MHISKKMCQNTDDTSGGGKARDPKAKTTSINVKAMQGRNSQDKGQSQSFLNQSHC